MYFILAAGGNFILENPANSVVTLHDRYVQLLRLLASRGVMAAWTLVVGCLCVYRTKNTTLQLFGECFQLYVASSDL